MKHLAFFFILCVLSSLNACAYITEVPLGPGADVSASSGPAVPGRIDPQIMSALINLFNSANAYQLTVATATLPGTALNDLLSLGSPIGYELRNEYTNLGVPLAEALAHENDPSFHDKLVQLANWTSDGETRAAALMVLANTHHQEDLSAFNQAILNVNLPNSLAVRFGAIEALTIWGFPAQAVPILKQEAASDPEPILKVYAAAQLARLGDPSALPLLRNFLNDGSWLVRAMAAHYLGDYGTGDDYDLIDAKISGETGNDFNQAEDCIASLKLFPKKPAPAPAPTSVAASTPAVASPLDAPSVLELEPLVITAPRLAPVQPGIDPQINLILLQLLQKKANSRPSTLAQSDASLGNLALISTLDGYNLQIRYSQLGFLLTEGLAGTKEFDLQIALANVARSGKNNQIKAAAMVALAYTKDPQYLSIFQSAMQSTDITTRFGALEALLDFGGPNTTFLISNAARMDSSLLLQAYAAASMWKAGDNSGEPILQNMMLNNDWTVRAIAVHYLGILGGAQEYHDLLLQLSQETQPMVQAELCLALIRLSKYQYQ